MLKFVYGCVTFFILAQEQTAHSNYDICPTVGPPSVLVSLSARIFQLDIREMWVCEFYYYYYYYYYIYIYIYLLLKASRGSCRSQWPLGLRLRSAAARLLRLWVQIPPGAWMFVCCELSGRGLCYELNHSSRGVLPAVVRRCV